MPIRRAISIRQPYVEQILRGTKGEEYRYRPTNIRERVYIYASLKPADDEPEWRALRKRPGDLPVGKIVGTVEIVGCEPRGPGDYAYLLARPRRLGKALVPRNQPTPCWWRPKF